MSKGRLADMLSRHQEPQQEYEAHMYTYGDSQEQPTIEPKNPGIDTQNSCTYSPENLKNESQMTQTQQAVEKDRLNEHRQTLGQKDNEQNVTLDTLEEESRQGSQDFTNHSRFSNKTEESTMPTPQPIGEVNTKYKTVDQKTRPVAIEIDETHAQPLRRPSFDPPIDYTPVDWPTPIWELPRPPVTRLTPERLQSINFGPPGFLNEHEHEALIKTTMLFDTVFTFNRSEKGKLSPQYADPYEIRTISHQPWIGKTIPLPKAKMTEIMEIYKDQLKNGDLEQSDSPYVTPHFFVEKKSGSMRKVVDMSALNKVTIRDANIPPNIVEFTEQLAGRVCYGSADAYSFFDQITLAPQSRPMTAIRTPLGLLQSTTLPQGATNSPAYAQRVSTHIFQEEIPQNAGVFVDDLIMKGPKERHNDELYKDTQLRRWFVEYLRTYSRLLRRYQHAGITVSGEKFIAITPSLSMTGVVIDERGRHPDPAKVAKLEAWPCPPPNVSSLRGFLGLANYLRPFIPNFATIDEPLRKLLTGRFRWSEKATAAMRQLQKAAKEHPILSNIDYESKAPLILAVDSSNIAAGFALFQEDEEAVNGRRLIHYGSIGFGDVEQRYSQAKLELCGVYKSIRVLRYYVYGTKLILEVDAASLREMINSPDVPNAAMTRWIAYLKYFDVEVRHVPGKKHTLPDGLSRTDFNNQEPAEDWPEEKVGLSAKGAPNEHLKKGHVNAHGANYSNNLQTIPEEGEAPSQEEQDDTSTMETESSTEERVETQEESEDEDQDLPFYEDKYTGKWLQLGRYL
ncbi:hypothetical protein CF326_g8523, partial [Tilletia indica]